MHRYRNNIKWHMRLAMARCNRMAVSVLGVRRTKMLLSRIYNKRQLDLDKPQKLNEKLLCAYYDSDMTYLAGLTDKYAVREHIRQKGLEEILVPIYGVYDSFDQIDFDQLPDQFVLKATHGCDMNHICRDKSKLDYKALRKKVEFWMRSNIAYMSLELHYAKIPPRILCEQYLDVQGEIVDYKFHCHDGQVLFVLVCSERSNGNYRDVFMPDWTHRPEAVTNAHGNPNGVRKPEQLQRMEEIARKLSEGIPFVRVDLYEVDGKIYFGELTFTPATGVLHHFTEDFLLEQGKRWT